MTACVCVCVRARARAGGGGGGRVCKRVSVILSVWEWGGSFERMCARAYVYASTANSVHACVCACAVFCTNI